MSSVLSELCNGDVLLGIQELYSVSVHFENFSMISHVDIVLQIGAHFGVVNVQTA